MDDQKLFAESGQGRDVNRHHYTPAEISKALESEVSQAIIAMARIRRSSAFEGTFSWKVTGPDSMNLSWSGAAEELSFDFSTKLGQTRFTLVSKSANGERVFSSLTDLAGY
jgi:sucrose phosphorylase